MLKRLFCSEVNILVLIVINSIVITLLYFPGLEGNPWLEWLDWIITILFVIEAIVKIQAWGMRGYFGNVWNRFDFLLVTLSFTSLVAGLFPIHDTSFWLLLRLFRLVRLVRLFRFVPHLEQVTAGLGRAIRAAFLVMAILAFFNFMLAMITCHFFRNISPDLFGNPFLAMYTMFQVFTVEGWNEIPKEIESSITSQGLTTNFLSGHAIVVLARIYFATTMLFGGIFGLSLANAVFVDEMTIDNTKELEAKIDIMATQIDELHAILISQKVQKEETS